jgi:hypothetical protein
VDSAARRQTKSRAPNTELEIPSAKLLFAQEKPAFEEADTTLRPALAGSRADDPAGAAKPRSETKSYVAARFNNDLGKASAAHGQSANPAERRGAIVEEPPTYVQRRDSSPTRMEMPEGPVGSPHRPLTPELLSPTPPRPFRAVNHPFDLPLTEGARAGQNAGVLPDSLTPPASAARTAPPPEPQPMARPSALWLVSGVLAAIILLALGVGLKQWVAGGPPPRQRTSHAASGGARTPYEATLRAEPTPTPSALDSHAESGEAGRVSPLALPVSDQWFEHVQHG